VRAASKRTYIKKIKRKTATSKGVSIDRIEHSFNIVLSHLRQVGAYKQTLAKHNVLVIYRCVRRCLENSESDMLDLAVEFEHLREYDNIDDFIEHLEKMHSVSKTYSNATLEDMALTELKEHADILGKKIVNKHAAMLGENEVAIPEIDYYYFKRRDAQLKKLERSASGWPLSLCC
jgi:hypothetical protein